jgi:hypothetical protein
MKIILTIMCACIILFGGGCAVLLASSGMGSGAGGLILLPLAVVALNLAVLAALYGWADMPAWPLYLLAGIDFILAVGGGVFAFYTLNDPSGLATLGFLPGLVAVIKGYLTIQVARKMQKPQ